MELHNLLYKHTWGVVHFVSSHTQPATRVIHPWRCLLDRSWGCPRVADSRPRAFVCSTKAGQVFAVAVATVIAILVAVSPPGAVGTSNGNCLMLLVQLRIAPQNPKTPHFNSKNLFTFR